MAVAQMGDRMSAAEFEGWLTLQRVRGEEHALAQRD
jgi:hypothetical protein